MRTLLVVALILASGCSSPSSAPPAEPDEPCVVEAADDYSCQEKDTGLEPDQVAHQHDYWRGQERVELLSTVAQGGGLISACEHWDWYTIRPEAPMTVYQGTATLEIDVRLTDSADSFYSDPQLWIKTATDDAPQFFADLSGSDSFVFESNNTANDLPHDRISSWEFHLFIAPGNDLDPFCDMRFGGTMEIDVEIVQGLEIPFYPGHPDRWQNRSEMPSFSHERTIDVYQGGQSGTCFAPTSGDCLWDPHLLDDGVVIPHDARRVVVTLDNQGDLPLQLLYHGADTRELTDTGLTVPAGQDAELEIDVGMQGDGPYARQSLWEFWVIPDHASDAYHGTYSLGAVAHRE